MTALSHGSKSRVGLVLAACCVGQFMVILDASVVNVALGVINDAFSFQGNGLLWVANSYTIVYAGFLLLGGRLADYFGRRRLFLLGIVIFTLASLVGGLAYNATTLILARGFQGLGAAIMAPATLTVLGTTFTEPAARAKAFGLWGAAAGGGGAVGVLAGGMIIEWFSWRWILLINIPIGIALLAAVAASVNESRELARERKLDLLGSFSITLGLMAVVFGIAESEQHGWGSARVVAALLTGTALLGFFLLDQAWIAKHPLMPLDFFRNRSVWTANLVAIVASAAIFSVFYLFTLFMQQVLGYSPLRTALVYLPLTLGVFLGSRGLAPYVRAIGPRRVLLTGLGVSAAGMTWLAQASPQADLLADLLGPSLLLGIGQGIVMTGTAMAATTGLPPDQAGLASGVLNTTRQLGGALGLTVLVAIASARANAMLADGASATEALSSGYLLALGVSSVFLIVSLIPALFVPRG